MRRQSASARYAPADTRLPFLVNQVQRNEKPEQSAGTVRHAARPSLRSRRRIVIVLQRDRLVPRRDRHERCPPGFHVRARNRIERDRSAAIDRAPDAKRRHAGPKLDTRCHIGLGAIAAGDVWIVETAAPIANERGREKPAQARSRRKTLSRSVRRGDHSKSCRRSVHDRRRTWLTQRPAPRRAADPGGPCGQITVALRRIRIDVSAP